MIGYQSVTNLLVPATGTTNAYAIRETFSGTPFFVNFNTIGLDGIPFRPYSVIADNTAGVDDLIILINEMSYRIIVPAGESLQLSYPAPVGHTVNITGNGDATVIFTDYPVLPYSSGGAGGGGSVPNPLPVTGPLTDAQLRVSPVQVELSGFDVTPYFYVSSAPGVTGNAHSFSIKNVGAADGTVAGTTLEPGESVSYSAPAGRLLSGMAFDATGTTFQIATVE